MSGKEGHKLILVVDDDETIVAMLKCILELEGYNVVTASGGEAGIALLKEKGADLILLDIMMPGLDGFQVLERIRQISNVPVIMLTAKDEVSTVHYTLEIGADDYVRKPFNTRELLARIEAKLRRAKQSILRV